MRVHHREKISIDNLTVEQAVQKLVLFLGDIAVTREFVKADDFIEELIVAPGAYCKLAASDMLTMKLGLKKAEDNRVGEIEGIPIRSPIYSHPHYQDTEGLSDQEIEYRILGD